MLLLGIFLYTRWRSYKGLKEGVYHVSAHHDGWEDIRENVLNYDEEGGGEEDQVHYSDARTDSACILSLYPVLKSAEEVRIYTSLEGTHSLSSDSHYYTDLVLLSVCFMKVSLIFKTLIWEILSSGLRV